MPMVESDLVVEPLRNSDVPSGSEPAGSADISEAAVRAAVMAAETDGRDPAKIPLSSLTQGSPSPTPASAQQTEVPEKFKKPTGEVDEEKLKASTDALKQSIQQKQEKLDDLKTVEDYLKEYRELESVNSSLPNARKTEAKTQELLTQAPSPAPAQMTNDQLRERLAADFQRDFVGTTSDLIDIIVERRISEKFKRVEEPIQKIMEDRKLAHLRQSIQDVAEKDARIMQPNHYRAIMEKLKTEPDYWKLKNPFRSAWNDVRDELRLGDSLTANQAQPSKPASPILGGGTPPPSPSQGSVLSAESFVRAVSGSNHHNEKEMDALDRAARDLFRDYR